MTTVHRHHFLDGLRGWAAIGVMFSHTIEGLLSVPLPWQLSYMLGKLTVWMFFVLSGAALSTRFMQTRKAEPFMLLAVRRYLRLTIPIFATSFFGYLLLKAGWMYHQSVPSSWITRFYHFEPSLGTYLSFSLWDVYTGREPSYNSNLWTMPLEMLGSLAVFMTLTVYALSGSSRLLYLLLFPAAYFYNNGILFYFLVGMAIAELLEVPAFQRFRQSRLSLPVGLALMIASVLLVPYGDVLYHDVRNALSGGLFVVGVAACRYISDLFALPVSRFLGRVSFPIYMFHLLVLCSLSSYMYVVLTLDGNVLNGFQKTFVTLVTVIVSFVCAWVFLPVERAALRWSHVITEHTWLSGNGSGRNRRDSAAGSNSHSAAGAPDPAAGGNCQTLHSPDAARS